MDNETWLIEEGDRIIIKKGEHGVVSLSSLEKLIYCLWVADYGMRNSGDLITAKELYPDFLAEGQRLADALNLTQTREAFTLSPTQLGVEYFKRFDLVCEELKAAL